MDDLRAHREKPDSPFEKGGWGDFSDRLPQEKSPYPLFQRGEKDGFRDHCGVVGIFGNKEAAKLTYLALYALQHRGQDSAGIVSWDGINLHRKVGAGLVADVFDERSLETLTGSLAIGHVRYTTAGSSGLQDAQPILTKTGKGYLSVAHNGNLVNADSIRLTLENEGAIFHTTSDTEVICHLVARDKSPALEDRLIAALDRVRGAYSLCVLGSGQLIGVRDPWGVRPLVLGRFKEGYILASETCAFDLVDAQFVREIDPGEMVIIDDNGVRSKMLSDAALGKKAQCIFEHVYFSRPDSEVFGLSVHAARKEMGRQLASEAPADADVVIAVPDSGIIAAMGYAAASNLPFDMGLVRNHYVGRTFIEPESRIRHFGVRLKLSPVTEVVEKRRLVVVDDSIVRGTTSRKIVKMLRAAGATEVHLRIAAPQTTNPCFYGIDTPKRSELIAATHTLEEIAKYLMVDSIGYLSVAGLHEAVNRAKMTHRFRGKTTGMCDACFSGQYPIPLHDFLGHIGTLSHVRATEHSPG